MSGDILDISWISVIKVDKHSKSGMGDNVKINAALIAEACGIQKIKKNIIKIKKIKFKSIKNFVISFVKKYSIFSEI